MTLMTALIIILLLIFGLFTAFILRHNIKYGYLSPHFKIILFIFGLMASTLILFSLVLLMQLYKGDNSSQGTSVSPPVFDTSTKSDLNF